MAKLIERQFTSKEKEKELQEKKLKFAKHFGVPDYMADLFYSEVKMRAIKNIDDKETEVLKMVGLHK